ncbi:hypothetical protein J6590_011972 [Homalodisca vitripennis]|nr:hypothetical protein J6590_011972 [Homalodisca vitripennis]
MKSLLELELLLVRYGIGRIHKELLEYPSLTYASDLLDRSDPDSDPAVHPLKSPSPVARPYLGQPLLAAKKSHVVRNGGFCTYWAPGLFSRVKGAIVNTQLRSKREIGVWL